MPLGVKTDPKIKEQAWLLYLGNDLTNKKIAERLNVKPGLIDRWACNEKWNKKREQHIDNIQAAVRSRHAKSVENTILRQHAIYNTIEEIIENQMADYLKSLKDGSEDCTERIKEADLIRAFPALSKDAREVFGLKAEYERQQKENEEKAEEEKFIHENPKLLKLAMDVRAAQEKLRDAMREASEEEKLDKAEVKN